MYDIDIVCFILCAEMELENKPDHKSGYNPKTKLEKRRTVFSIMQLS